MGTRNKVLTKTELKRKKEKEKRMEVDEKITNKPEYNGLKK